MALMDISVPMRPGMPVWPGDPEFGLLWPSRVDAGDASTNSRIALSSHTGTHVDAPMHFIRGGVSLDAVPPDVFVGPCRVVDAGDAAAIPSETVRRAGLDGIDRVVFRTRNSAWIRDRFDPEFVAFEPEAAEALAAIGPRLVGIDAPSVDPYGAPGHPAHMALLGSGRVLALLEWLALGEVEAGDYELLCAPLAVAGAEAAPCRALLRSI